MGRCDELDAAIYVVDYDDQWPVVAEREIERLRHGASPFSVRIEHVGSTAVKGLVAKPVVDLMVGVEDDDALAHVLAVLSEQGYRQPEYGRTDGVYMVAERNGHCVSVHVLELGGASWREMDAMRAYLRAHPDEVRRYGEEKRRILSRAGNDHPRMYGGGKSNYVRALADRAAAWAAQR